MLQWIQNLDWRLLDGLRGLLSCSFLDALMPLITHLGDAGAIWILCGMALLASKKYRKNGLWLLCGLANEADRVERIVCGIGERIK